MQKKKDDFIWHQIDRAMCTQNSYVNIHIVLILSINVKLYIINTEIVCVKY